MHGNIGNQNSKKFNRFCNLSNNTTIVELTQGQWCILDTEDWEKIKHLKWYVNWNKGTETFYVHTTIRLSDIKRTVRGMHTFIKFSIKPLVTDHINGDTLDNRKINLQIITEGENRRKGKKAKRSRFGELTSEYVNVSFCKEQQKYRPQVRINFKLYNLTRCKTQEEAHKIAKEAIYNWNNHRILPVVKKSGGQTKKSLREKGS